MDVIVHVGPHKTATTSLQHFLYNNRDSLLDCGVYYPIISFGVPNKINHNDLAASMIAGDDKKTNVFLGMIEEVGRRSPKIIISGEDFSTCINTKMDAGLRILEDRFPGIRYIFVDRDDTDRFTSSVIHTLSESPQSLYQYGSLGAYIKAMVAYGGQQRAFFRDRGATFMSFKDFVAGGVGRSFLKEAVHIDFEGQPVVANAASIYSEKLDGLPDADKRKLCNFVGGDVADLYAHGAASFIKNRVLVALRAV